jgi:hypothetical protein
VNKVNKVVLRTAAVADSDRVAAQRQWSAEALLDPSGDAL